MIAITGATGQLGHLVLQNLLKTTAASQIVAIVRNPAKAEALSQQGIVVARPIIPTKRHSPRRCRASINCC